jgi:predicted transcriptional regulator
MPALTTKANTAMISVRMPDSLERQLAELAHRNANTLSATARWLLARGIRQERRDDDKPTARRG